MDERIGFWLYQSCENRGSVGCVSVYGLRWCRWGVGKGPGSWSGRVELCLWRCESGFSVQMAGSGICVLFLAGTCTSEVHPMFNHVAPYGYMFPNMDLFIGDITNPYLFV